MWILTSECDSLLFSCLYAVAVNRPFDIERAYWDSKWHRRPAEYGECSSTISRDMLLGLLVYCLHFRRLDILDALWSYGWRHGWKLGIETKPGENRVWASPSIVSLIQQIRVHLRGGKSWLQYVPDVYDTTPGYRSHLTMLKCYLHLCMRGSLTRRQTKALQSMLEHSSLNPLVHALLGNGMMARMLLRRYWPVGRVANTHDWTEAWRTQRQDGDSGFKPDLSRPAVDHTDGDRMFVNHILQLQAAVK